MQINYEKTVFSVRGAIRKTESGLIWFDHPMKKESNQWSTVMKGNLISDILQDNPIPDLVFVKGKSGGVVCIDGKKRFMSVRSFINNEYRLDHDINRYLIDYWVPVLDYDGIPIRDNEDIIVHKKQKIDIRMKKFKDLPKELQERILDYCFDVILIDYCDNESIKYHIKRFNAQSSLSSTDTQLDVEIELEKYKKENEQLRKKLESLLAKYSGLGRKEKFNDDGKKRIIELRSKGYSIDKIKDLMQCSKGLVHKIIKEYNK